MSKYSAYPIPDNLILDLDGNLTCKDGQDLKEYLKAYMSTLSTTEPLTVNIVRRSWYVRLVANYGFNFAS